ncbi:MAG: FAD-binding oxidoreductase [Anaerolineae bacterium]|nr:FAD-binding oxidoreductase [Anaerolineae bacterium]
MDIASLTTRIAGEVILPDTFAYTELRSIFNQTSSPAIIVRVKNNEDIATAIQFAQDYQLKLAVRSGGHGLTGLATNDGGLVIDLSHLNQVEVLDPAEHLVRIGAGAKWGQAAEALAAHGLALSSGDTKSVGVGGLTLGGGIGWMVRKYGLTIDRLEAAEIVTATGDTVRVSAHEHPDLFWAIRGGGGNFGVVTSFDFRAQPVQAVVGGLITYDLTETESVLKKWAAFMRTAPEELSSTLVVFSGFGPQFPPQIMVYAYYAGGDQAAANAAIQPLLELGAVKSQDIQKKPYHTLLEEGRVRPAGIRMVSESGFIRTVSDDAVAAIATHFGQPGTPIIQVRSLGGAVARIRPHETAFAHRDSEAVFWSVKMIPADSAPEVVEGVRQETWQWLKPFASGAYVNFLSDASDPSVAAAYPPATYDRLAAVKALYDPDNVFNQNHNVRPVVGNYA